MDTGLDAGFLQESPNENSSEAISNQGTGGTPISTGSIRASSSPAILELSKEECRQQDGRPTVLLEKHLTQSCPPRLSETTPLLNSNAESSSPEPSGRDNHVEQVEESRCSGFFNLLECCTESIVFIRNSILIVILPIVCAALPLTTIIMGLLYAGKCRYLPISGATAGVIGIIFMGLWMAIIVCRHRGMPCSDTNKFIICFVLLALVILVVVDLAFVCLISPSFTRGDKNYCDETFYKYSVKKEVWIVTAFVVSAIFYLPRSRHYLCCGDCCSSRSALPNMRYLSIQSIE